MLQTLVIALGAGLDHVIVGGGNSDYYSFRESGMVDFTSEKISMTAEQIAKGVKLPSQEEVTIKFGKGLAEPFQSKDGREFMRITIPNQDPADKTPWARPRLKPKRRKARNCDLEEAVKAASYIQLLFLWPRKH